MALSNIRAAIKTLIGSVTGIDLANVFDYYRSVHKPSMFKSLFKSSDNKINTWWITRGSTEEVIGSTITNGGVNYRHYRILIYGFYGAKDADASEKTFQDLIEAVCAKLRENHTLSGTALTSNPPQVDRVGHQMLGGTYMVHECVISVVAREQIIYTTS